MKYIKRKLKEKIEKIKKGCGMKIGVPLFVKFKPCGEIYKEKHYFCNSCSFRLNLFKEYLYYYEAGEKGT